MGYSCYIVFILNGGSNGYRTRTFTYIYLLHLAIGKSLVNVFAVMRCYIDVFGVEFA